MDARHEPLLPRPTVHATRIGTLYPTCVVCGQDHNHEETHTPETSIRRVDEGRRFNESCDGCWAWSLTFEAGKNAN